MQQHLQTLINLLQQNNIKGLLQHYLGSTEAENTAQLAFMFQQSEIKQSNFNYYQSLATSLVEAKGLSHRLITKIKTNNTLNFFTPALQIADNFKKTDLNKRNVLHYLFASNGINTKHSQPPFNYLRSMMLFGSNQALRDGLCQRDNKNLTPIEAYLFTNKNINPLANHELTALLALIEIESKQQTLNMDNYDHLIKTVGKLFIESAQLANLDSQRILLIASYYSILAQRVVSDIDPDKIT